MQPIHVVPGLLPDGVGGDGFTGGWGCGFFWACCGWWFPLEGKDPGRSDTFRVSATRSGKSRVRIRPEHRRYESFFNCNKIDAEKCGTNFKLSRMLRQWKCYSFRVCSEILPAGLAPWLFAELRPAADTGDGSVMFTSPLHAASQPLAAAVAARASCTSIIAWVLWGNFASGK